MPGIRGLPVEERFWQYIKIGEPEECWEWQSNRGIRNYGLFTLSKGKTVRASRFVYELTNGPIPEGMFICHKCDNPPCCNPDHLFLGTPKENTADMIAKGRNLHRAARGEKSAKAKLTEKDVRRIREYYNSGQYKQAELAKMFHMSFNAIHAIVNRTHWKHID